MNKILIVCVVVVLGSVAWANAHAEKPKIKYCKNYENGRVIVVEAGFPCPSGFVEL